MTEKHLKDVLVAIDAAAQAHPDDPTTLFDEGFANAMEHNLDFPGSGQKAIDAYTHLLALEPDSRQANYFCGSFLSQTSYVTQSIPAAIETGQLRIETRHMAAAVGEKQMPEASYGDRQTTHDKME